MRARSWLAAALALALAPSLGRADSLPPDVRQFRVGMPLSALPGHGYVEFRCVAADNIALAGWADFQKCPADAAGLHEVGFRYDDDGEHQTKVAGQPVLMSLLLTQDGTVQAIRMRTDPSARLFLRKRAYIFGEQVMARYGASDWVCKDANPSGGEEPVGGVFLREHCEKTAGDRHLVVDRALYRESDKSLSAFVSETVFVVSLARPNQG